MLAHKTTAMFLQPIPDDQQRLFQTGFECLLEFDDPFFLEWCRLGALRRYQPVPWCAGAPACSRPPSQHLSATGPGDMRL